MLHVPRLSDIEVNPLAQLIPFARAHKWPDLRARSWKEGPFCHRARSTSVLAPHTQLFAVWAAALACGHAAPVVAAT
jgi:hypothetical protein